MEKKFFMALSLMCLVSLASFSNPLSGKKERKAPKSPVASQSYNGLELSSDQMLKLRQIDQDFFSKRQKSIGKERKAQAKQQQKRRNERNKEFARQQKQNQKMQRDYLQSVRKVMTEKQYMAFLENQWFGQPRARKAPAPYCGKGQCPSLKKQQRGKKDGAPQCKCGPSRPGSGNRVSR